MKNQKLHHVLHAAREKQNLTLRDIERLSKGAITNPYVSQLESGAKHQPGPSKLKVLSTILKLDFWTLMVLAGHISEEDQKFIHARQAA